MVIFSALLFWRIASRTRLPANPRYVYAGLYCIALVALWLTAWHGGELVYGLGVGGELVRTASEAQWRHILRRRDVLTVSSGHRLPRLNRAAHNRHQKTQQQDNHTRPDQVDVRFDARLDKEHFHGARLC